jgi:hypothetical protein
MKLYYYDSNSLLYKKVKFNSYIWGIIISFLIFSSFGFSTAFKFNDFVEKIPIIIRENNDSFSEDKLRKEIRHLNLKYEDVLIKQYKLETSSGKSEIFKRNNNLFGMKVATQRPTTAIGENLNHAYYSNWKECVIDMGFWQLQNARDIKSEDEYYQLLDGMYSETNNYSTILKSIK